MLWEEIQGACDVIPALKELLKVKFRIYLGNYSDFTVEYVLVTCFWFYSVGDCVFLSCSV